MLAMFMVAVLHILGQGGVLYNAEKMSLQYEIAYFLETGAYCAVNCYALISGYVGVDSKFKFSNIVVLWLRVVFYTIIITVIFSIYIPTTVTWRTWLYALCPVMFSQYWYFTAYFGMFLFIPILNVAIDKLSKEQMQIVVISLIVVFSVLRTVFCEDAFKTDNGYTAWWLMILYIIGGYIKRYGFMNKYSKKMLFIGYFALICLTWLFRLIVEYEELGMLEDFKGSLLTYTSPTILFSGICLLLVFKEIRVTDFWKNVIKKLSTLTFSVYIIHAHPLIWNNFMAGRFIKYAHMKWYMEIIAVLGTALGIYLVCLAVDMVREYIFKVCKVKYHVESVEKRISAKVKR
jgi:surface polysaccharide O-acyltransferase-like enzyme